MASSVFTERLASSVVARENVYDQSGYLDTFLPGEIVRSYRTKEPRNVCVHEGTAERGSLSNQLHAEPTRWSLAILAKSHSRFFLENLTRQKKRGCSSPLEGRERLKVLGEQPLVVAQLRRGKVLHQRTRVSVIDANPVAAE